MAINVTFNGATIYKPGAYSEVEIDLSGGFPVGPTGLVAIFGESTSGVPGALVPDISQNVYTPDEFPLIQSTYGSGPLVDACNFLFAPAADGAIPSGAQAIYIYKTNSSTVASLELSNNYGTLQAEAYGQGGNQITYTDVAVPAVPAQTMSSASFNLTSPPFSDASSDVPQSNTPSAQAAHAAAVSAYSTLEGMSPTPISNNLAGQTLTPGVYSESSGTFNIAASGTLTLNGAGTYVFQCSSTLVTGASAVVALTGGATAANVYFVCGSSATLGATNTFNGNIVADASISLGGGTVNGSMIALTGAVTISVATNVNAQSASVLGVAGAYGVLGASAVTNTGATVVDGSVGVSPGTSITGFPPGTITGGSDLVFVLRINGAGSSLDNTFTLPTPVVTTSALQSALTTAGNWSNGLPSGMTFTVSGTNSAAFLDIVQSLASNPQRNGAGQNFQLVSGSMLAAVNIAPGLYVSESEDMSVITIYNNGTLVQESGTVGGDIVVEIGRNGGVNPVVTVNATQMLLINNSAIEYTITLANFGSLSALVAYINSSTGGNWSASVGSALFGQLPTSAMDEVSNLPANGSNGSQPAQIKDDAYSVQQFFLNSSNVSLIQSAGQGAKGLPDPQATIYLAGGELGGTSTAAIVNALAAFQNIRINSVIPLFSRDASADIADGLTDPSSNYTILGIHQAVKTFLSLMATVKAKNECQGYLSLKDTYANCVIESQNLADARIQLVIQDILQINAAGVTTWFEPWAGACLLAGARGGSPVGTPMTFKYFNTSGIRQTAQSMNTPEAQIVNGFNPATQYDNAIQNGITFWEHPSTGGYRLVVDNTTYGADDNWVYNRASVLYASDVLVFDFRSQLENIYIGVKNTVSAAEVKSTCDAILSSYLAQGITVSTADAPNGYKQLVVQIVGNTINVSVVVKLVEGIDFVLATITLQRASSTA